jgi:hypothetical protein
MFVGFWWEIRKERPLRRPTRRWEDNFKMDLTEIGWIYLAQDGDQQLVLVNTVVNLLVP